MPTSMAVRAAADRNQPRSSGAQRRSQDESRSSALACRSYRSVSMVEGKTRDDLWRPDGDVGDHADAAATVAWARSMWSSVGHAGPHGYARELTSGAECAAEGRQVSSPPNTTGSVVDPIAAARSRSMFKKVNVPVLRIIENMKPTFSARIAVNRSDNLRHGGARNEAERLGVHPFPGRGASCLREFAKPRMPAIRSSVASRTAAMRGLSCAIAGQVAHSSRVWDCRGLDRGCGAHLRPFR
ncbi:hypothetical protein AXF42_Ash015929 [Apostasia shenzhenica]|uniref:Uncharacterized protein n=1 Tax=Apostasia shenzhenica TaxID=1088818 RepID=A0A2I0AWF4_9ASPA|nr:hypothetical protein AXF42_Ash015929 [Apostasia shenzhenica]